MRSLVRPMMQRRGIVLGLGLLLLASCDDGCRIESPSDPIPPPPPPAAPCPDGLALAVDEITLPMGRQTEIGLAYSHRTCPVAWTVEDDAVVHALGNSKQAILTGLTPGTTTIRAHRDSVGSGIEAACVVTVHENTFVSLTVSADSVLLDAGNPNYGELLAAIVLDKGGERVAPLGQLDFTSSDTTVVTVSPLFAILDVTVALMPAGPGEAIVTVTYEGVASASVLSDTCVVSVAPPKAPGGDSGAM